MSAVPQEHVRPCEQPRPGLRPRRYLVVTLDTEVDKDPRWHTANPASFHSIVEGIPRRLTPLFARYGVKPTYLLSAEAIEDRECVRVLSGLGDSAELAAHLHPEFVEPGRKFFPENLGGAHSHTLLKQYPREAEAAKLANLTRLFEQTFGRRPKSFRAGRFGLSSSTLELLAGLGYAVDTSVTPGMRWRLPEGELDYRHCGTEPFWVETPAGRILELPITIRPASRLSAPVQELPRLPRRVVAKLLGSRAGFRWLRPGFASGRELVRFVQQSTESVLVMMFHSMEIVPGGNPYVHSEEEVARFLADMEEVFSYCVKAGIGFCSAAECAALVSAEKVGRV